MRRVTAPGGSVVALEITQPTLPGWRQAFRLYFHHVVPGDRRADRGEPRGVHVPSPVGRPLRDAGRARAAHGGGRAPRRPRPARRPRDRDDPRRPRRLRHLDHPRRARERRGLTGGPCDALPRARRRAALLRDPRRGPRARLRPRPGRRPPLLVAAGAALPRPLHVRDLRPPRVRALDASRPAKPGPDAFVDDLAALVDHLGSPTSGWWRSRWAAGPASATRSAIRTRVRALVMACTTGTLDDPETLALFRAHGAAAARGRGRRERGIHPACRRADGAGAAGAPLPLPRGGRALPRPRQDRGPEEADRDADDAARDGRRAPDAAPLRHRRGGRRHPAGGRRRARVDRARAPASRACRRRGTPSTGSAPQAFNRLVDEFLAGDAR